MSTNKPGPARIGLLNWVLLVLIFTVLITFALYYLVPTRHPRNGPDVHPLTTGRLVTPAGKLDT